jgi:DNA-binding NarL/FixJ family response regulator
MTTLLNPAETLLALSRGVHPVTGELLKQDSIINHSSVVRALIDASMVMEREMVKRLRKKDLPENAGAVWTPSEEELMIKLYKEGKKSSLIARELKRTVGSIKARVVKVGLEDEIDQVR